MRALALALALAVLLASGRRDRDLPAALWTDVKDAGKEGVLHVNHAPMPQSHALLEEDGPFPELEANFEAPGQKPFAQPLRGSGCLLRGSQGLTKLQHLHLSHTQVTGVLEPLAGLAQLKRLYLSSTRVTGHLEVLAGLTQLQRLLLSHTQVTGVLEVLAGLTQLQWLYLPCTRVTGVLEPLAGLTQLQRLDLFSTRVTGVLEPLAGLAQLQRLDLSRTRVTGHLEPLAGLTQLQRLYLSRTQVTGHLEPLTGLTQLQHLYLAHTQVTGHLEPLAGLTQLRRLYLSRTRVTGHLEPLAGLTQLQRLYLYSTQVTGHLEPLAGLTQLQCLDLHNTSVDGELETLKDLSDLSEVDLSATRLEGQLSESWRGKLRKLQMLNLGSRARVLPERGELQELFIDYLSMRLFPALVTLDAPWADQVSDCPLERPVQDLLWPLAASGHLARVIAKRAGLSGNLPDIDGLRGATVDFRRHAVYANPPLAKSLQTLDLSGNRLDSVEWFAQTYTSISGNGGNMSINQGSLDKTLRSGGQVDLAGTEVTNGRELVELLASAGMGRTSDITVTNTTGGYGCYSLTQDALRITPSLFFPEGLCGCLPGHQGHGASCSKCPPNSYNKDFNSSSCTSCPEGSSADEGGASIESCQCEVGRTDAGNEMHEVGELGRQGELDG
ncbi:inlA, partial [Symbiodinium natans]